MNEQELKEGKINPSYYAQCQHYMAVTGLPVWYIAILCFQRGFYVFRIERNEEDIAALIESEQEFWNENVLKDIPPATDGSYSTTSSLNHLLSMYGNMLDQPVDLDDMTEDLDEYEMLTEMLESLNTRKDEITNRFKIRLADAETGYCKQRKITFKPQTSKRIDSKTLRKEMPEIAEKYTKESKPVRVLRIK
jgi:predicted phage-related endonuclease